MKEIYQQTVEEVLERVNGKKSGLTSEQVKRSREKCGWNELTEGKKKGILQIFFEQYKDFLVLILIASAIISGMLGDVESAAVIVTVITINAILGTIQTVKAEQSLQSLKNLSGPEAKVLRDGTVVQIPARELVVGDVILLEAGDMIPADGRLIENASLKIDESALTGESLAVEKNMDTILTEAPLGDRTNMLFSGSFVTYGRGKAVVTDIGMQTEVGKIAGLLKSTSEKQTPLQVSLEVFGKKLSIMILVFCGLLFAINVFRGEKISSAFMFAVALAVAAIPEALSSIVTIYQRCRHGAGGDEQQFCNDHPEFSDIVWNDHNDDGAQRKTDHARGGIFSHYLFVHAVQWKMQQKILSQTAAGTRKHQRFCAGDDGRTEGGESFQP